MKRLPLLLLSGLVVAAVAACPGKAPEPPAPIGANTDSIAEAQRLEEERRAREAADAREREEAERRRQQQIADSLAALGQSTAAVRTLLATTIHFDYDKALIRGGDAAVLDQKVAILQVNPTLRIRISGHCDERGSDEYNLALGNRRGTAAKQYLVSHGIDADRIETVSYGEERPLDSGHDEEAWSRNRRDEFEILSGGDALKQP
jgi:peptidoglycan-associated lipoprotein